MIWLVLFYTAWVVAVLSAGLWSVVCQRWPIALAMAGGSFVGGGALVLAAVGVIALNTALHLLFMFGQRSLPLKV